MDFQTVNIIISDEVAANMEERGIREEDVREVIAYAEETGKKLYVEGESRFLGRKRIGKFSAYAEYGINGDEIELFDIYSHMVTFEDEE